jgi:hypothetical protein
MPSASRHLQHLSLWHLLKPQMPLTLAIQLSSAKFVDIGAHLLGYFKDEHELCLTSEAIYWVAILGPSSFASLCRLTSHSLCSSLNYTTLHSTPTICIVSDPLPYRHLLLLISSSNSNSTLQSPLGYKCCEAMQKSTSLLVFIFIPTCGREWCDFWRTHV